MNERVIEVLEQVKQLVLQAQGSSNDSFINYILREINYMEDELYDEQEEE